MLSWCSLIEMLQLSWASNHDSPTSVQVNIHHLSLPQKRPLQLNKLPQNTHMKQFVDKQVYIGVIGSRHTPDKLINFNYLLWTAGVRQKEQTGVERSLVCHQVAHFEKKANFVETRGWFVAASNLLSVSASQFQSFS